MTASALSRFIFYVGVSEPSWLNFLTVPSFISRRRLQRLRKIFPRARTRWALDSGGFTEIQLFGGWRMTAREYVAFVRFLIDEVGNLDFAIAQDWPVTPITNRLTGLSAKAHQARTLNSYIELVDLAPELPWCPVLTGWSAADFMEMASAYYSCAVDLELLPVVALGGLATRQHEPEIAELVAYFHRCGFRLHGLGFKRSGLGMCAHMLASADSQSWSQEARLEAKDGARRTTPNCAHTQHCGNCLHKALEYRAEIMNTLPRSLESDKQTGLFSIAREPHYLELYQTWGRARDRAIPLRVREELFAREAGLARAA